MLINSMSPENTKYIKNIKENDKLLKNVMKKEEIDKKEKSNICICKYIDKYDMKNLIDEIKKKKKKNDVENSNNSYSEDDVCFYELYKFICSNNIEGNNENIFDDTNINVENVSKINLWNIIFIENVKKNQKKMGSNYELYERVHIKDDNEDKKKKKIMENVELIEETTKPSTVKQRKKT
ncbi:hypothetical protein PFMALIP_05069 [Plasmodium falciparum MaliPS096_E11]|uniref:Uncharacterized protein n=1 Tax=Plasmodium falciparum MaliPS096_E11 TaxID=1036727 RepID=A0A024WK84_PLAFA|nr:hypothetical protein PFMALIP_05069 [Plasmodium falciparum MaliPS096_E11]